MTNAEHHLHKRRLIHKNLEHYPHPEKRKYVIDALVFFIGGVGPIFSIPQLLKVWDEKDTSGLSIITWGAYFVFSCIWLAYGIIYKEKPIIFANSFYVLINAFVVIGIILF